jgi:uncharacterized membrane protein required for colicin V production
MNNDNEIYDVIKENEIKDVTRDSFGSFTDLVVGYIFGFMIGLGIIKLFSFFISY